MERFPSHRRARPGGWWRRQRLQRMALRLGMVALALVSVIALRAAEQARATHGATVAVLEMVDSFPRGHVLSPADVRAVEVPASLLPTGAIAAAGRQDLAGSVLAHPLNEGEILTDLRLGSEELVGLARRVPEGTRAMAVPLGDDAAAALSLEAGLRLDLVDAGDPFDERWGGTGAGPHLVATDVVVLEATERAVVVAVPDADVARVAAAASGHGIAVAVRGAS
ncbi:MAG: hypothetical protein JJU45_16320 [Acidimicrobiia bacterium]|nr:hypothetical protein [Acidimicrobiia bacterium]